MKCLYCAKTCDIKENSIGYCGMFENIGGKIEEKYPDRYTSYHTNHIEQLPFYHAYPGSRTLLVGTLGCNFDCDYCINSYVAKAPPKDLYLYYLSPEKVVDIAKRSGCHNIVFGVNEVLVSLPTAVRVAKEASKEGIPVGCLSNGYMTEESMETVAENFEFINISLKSITSSLYKKLTTAKNINPVLETIEYLASKIHVELTTPIIQSVNDNEINDIAKFISSINKEIPWHVFRMLPHYNMEGKEYPDIDVINESLEKARELLNHIYFSNFVGSKWVTTYCSQCGSKLIERVTLGACGGKLLKSNMVKDKCHKCGRKIYICGTFTNWSSKEAM